MVQMRRGRGPIRALLACGLAAFCATGAFAQDGPAVLLGEPVAVRPGQTAMLAIQSLGAPDERVQIIAAAESAPAWLAPTVWRSGPAANARLKIELSPPADAEPGRHLISVHATTDAGFTTAAVAICTCCRRSAQAQWNTTMAASAASARRTMFRTRRRRTASHAWRTRNALPRVCHALPAPTARAAAPATAAAAAPPQGSRTKAARRARRTPIRCATPATATPARRAGIAPRMPMRASRARPAEPARPAPPRPRRPLGRTRRRSSPEPKRVRR